MAGNDFNIGQLFKEVFGLHIGIAFKIPSPPSAADIAGFAGINSFKADVRDIDLSDSRQSWLGTPIMFPSTLKGGNNIKILNARGEIERVRYADFVMPAATLIDIERSKIIAKTQTASGNGTVKEIYGFDDFKIRIRGFCLDEPGIRTALQQKQGLAAYEKIAGSIEVKGSLFEMFDIYRINITNASFPQIEGKPNVLPFELQCESDNPLELIL